MIATNIPTVTEQEADNNTASLRLAFSYYYGLNVNKDPDKAYCLLMKNPMPNDGMYRYLVGMCNLCGQGTKLNPEKGLEELETAHSLGFSLAGLVLKDYYLAIGNIAKAKEISNR